MAFVISSALLLAQAGTGLSGVPRLEQTWSLQDRLFAEPFAIVMVLVLGAGVAFWFLRRSGRRRAGVLAGLVLLSLAGGLVAAALLVTTTRERVIKDTGLLVKATASVDVGELDQLLAPDVVASYYGRRLASHRPDVESRIRDVLAAYPVTETDVESVRARVEGPRLARTQCLVSVRSSAGLYDVPVRALVNIDWRRDGDETWRAVQIDCAGVNVPGAESVNP